MYLEYTLLIKYLIMTTIGNTCSCISCYTFCTCKSLTLNGLLWLWSYGSWIYNYLCNQCLSPLSCEFEPHSWWVELDTTLCDKFCQWLETDRWFSLGTPVSSTNKIDCHNTTEILLKVAFNTIDQPTIRHLKGKIWLKKSWQILSSCITLQGYKKKQSQGRHQIWLK